MSESSIPYKNKILQDTSQHKKEMVIKHSPCEVNKHKHRYINIAGDSEEESVKQL